MKKRQILCLIFALLWMAVIFRFSAKPAIQSSAMSHRVGRVVCRIFVPDYELLSEEEQGQLAARIDHPIRKTAHAVEYMILGVLVFGSLSLADDRLRREAVCTLLAGVVYAASDELHQYFVPGRSCQLSDVCLDSGGVIVGTAIVYLSVKLVRYIGSKQNDRKAE